ncbi:prolipoprotein diacylglyceryl transferase [Gilvimarinus sp. F26214L]|uniref:prolipoprotein diacylglyceryl transferase n=1 Tax=Gilvimarinus sp. DZF01 TaxID=3461371 RepID=UPI00404556A2
MLSYPDIDPVAFSLGPLQVHWYGIAYLCGFAAAWWIAVRRSRLKHTSIRKEQIEDLIVYGALGVILGGRIGYVLFYQFDVFLANPLWLFKVWEGGMSFHGGMLGVVAAMWLYARKHRIHFLDLMDFVAPAVPPGLGFGRLGNFIGQELWGRETNVPWGMVFPKDELGLVRHPSQLYEAALEGLVLFVILYWYAARPRPRGAVAALFVLLYGCFRFAVEFTRQPDAHIQFDLFGWVTRGQLLSLPMILVGAGVLVWTYRNPRTRPLRY